MYQRQVGVRVFAVVKLYCWQQTVRDLFDATLGYIVTWHTGDVLVCCSGSGVDLYAVDSIGIFE